MLHHPPGVVVGGGGGYVLLLQLVPQVCPLDYQPTDQLSTKI